MAYEPLTKEQFQQARSSGFTPEKIVQMEQKRKLDSGMTPRQERIEQGLPVGRGERAEPTMGGSLLRGVVGLAAKPLASLASIEKTLSGKPAAEAFAPQKSEYLGDTYGIGLKPQYEIEQRKAAGETVTPKEEFKAGLKGGLGGVGYGAEVASYLPVGRGVKAVGTAVAQPFKQSIKQSALQTAKEGVAGGVLGSAGQQLQEKGKVNLLETSLSGLAGGALGGALGAAGSGLSRLVSKVPAQEVKRRAVEATSKALGISGKRPATQALVQPEKMAQGLVTIQKYAPVDTKSENIFDDTVKSLVNAKENVFQIYDDIARESGKAGVDIDTQPLESKLSKYLTGITTGPKRQRAERILSELRTNFPTGKASPTEMQDYIRLLNEELGGVTGGAERGAVGVTSEFTRSAREALDDAISRTGSEYQVFKDDYAALKSIEDSLVKQYQKVMRKKGGGLTDYADMIANAEMLSGIVSANPALMAKSLALRLGSKVIKNLNDPETWLRKAFEGIEEYGDDIIPKVQKRTEQLRLPAPKPGALRSQVGSGSPINLGSRAQSTIDAQEIASIQGVRNEIKSLDKLINSLMNEVDEIPESVKLDRINSLKSDIGDAEAMIGIIEDQIKNNPAKGLIKYTNKRTGELPEVLGKGKSIFGRKGDDITRDFFDDSEQARASIDRLRASQDQLKGYKEELKAKKEMLKSIEGNKLSSKPPKLGKGNETFNKLKQSVKDQGGFIQSYKEVDNLTTKILKDLEGKTTVSKQYILDATNRPELKQVERDITRQVLEDMTSGNVEKKAFDLRGKLQQETGHRADKMVTLYHGTDAKSAQAIRESGKMGRDAGDITFFTKSAKEAKEYAQNKSKYRGSTPEVIKVEVPAQVVRKGQQSGAGGYEYEVDGILDYNDGIAKHSNENLVKSYGDGSYDTINVKEFADKVKSELLPVKRVTVDSSKYEGVSLPHDIRGDIIDYQEHIYESPIATSAGDTHFSGKTKKYFGHTRTEDLPYVDVQEESIKLVGDKFGLENAKKVLSESEYNRYANFKENARRLDTKERSSYNALSEKIAERSFDDYKARKLAIRPTDKIRRVIEVQSDLYQKGNLERELNAVKPNSGKFDSANKARIAELLPEKQAQEYKDLWQGVYDGQFDKSKAIGEKGLARLNELEKLAENSANNRMSASKLAQYNDPTAHFRMIREEIKKASQDGKTKLQFPTGETAMKIEGLSRPEQWSIMPESGIRSGNDILSPEKMKVGTEVYMTNNAGDNWIITDVLGDGKFKAVPKSNIDEKAISNSAQYLEGHGYYYPSRVETFDISGKVDTNNPIYKFYEKDVQKYLNKYGGKRVVDDKGVSWIEIPITKEQGTAPVEAFGQILTSPLIATAGITGLGALGARQVKKQLSKKPEKLGQPKQAEKVFDREDFSRRIVNNVENEALAASGGDLYKSIGFKGDLGKYQVSPPSLKEWSKEWLGKEYSKDEFLNDPQAQEKFWNNFLDVVERLQLSPEEAAVTWHTGWGDLGQGTREQHDKIFRESLANRMNSDESKRYLSKFNK